MEAAHGLHSMRLEPCMALTAPLGGGRPVLGPAHLMLWAACSQWCSHSRADPPPFPQVGLGISTLLLYVPTPLAATHQSGSLALLSVALWLMSELRRMPK